jgi:hypothetical protein
MESQRQSVRRLESIKKSIQNYGLRRLPLLWARSWRLPRHRRKRRRAFPLRPLQRFDAPEGTERGLPTLPF